MPPALSPSSLRQRPLESARLAPRLIAIAIAGAFSGTYAVPAMALPTGAQVAAGQAVVTKPQANVLNIQSAPNTIINWQQFNIGASESVRIQQQSAASAILNRVVGGEASKILGQLSSNGRVFLINPSGIVFGQGARIDTAGFIASSLNISDANFLAGKLTFEGTHKNGIKNEGTIKSLGEIILIAPKIENSGILQTEGGDIILAAGQKVTITNLANPEVLVEIKAPDNEVVNLGRILSNGGAISVLANRLRHSGEINATRAEVGPGGRITLSGDDELTITPDAKVISNGSPAGQITLQSANGTTTIEGTIEARGIAPNPAQVTASTRGGRIEVLGQEVTLASTAVVDASGERGGGAIYIGGDYQGGSTPLPERWALNPATQPLPASTQAAATRAETLLTAPVQSAPVMTEAPPAPPSDQSGGSAIADQPLLPPVRNPLQNSRTTTIASGARVRADARSEGDGGTIIVWSEASTRVYGSLSARGGALGGNGGFVETSGRRYLDIGAIPPDLGASKGLAGLWLLDPNNITIQATGSDTNISGSPNFVSTADGAIITIATIKAALDAGTSVTISTSGGGAQLGDITIGSALATTSATDVTLTLNAHNNIAINAGLSATGTGKLNVVLNANTDAAGGGAASLNSSASLALKGGTVSSGNGSALTITSGTLNNVTLATNVNVTGSATFQNGLTLDNATVTITGASFYYSGTQTLGGTGNVVFAGSSAWLYRNGGAATLTVGPNVTVSGSGTGSAIFGYSADEAIDFQGVLNASVAGKTWYLGGFANTGNINVSAGTVRMDTYSGTGSWTNTSTVGKGIAVSGTGVLNLVDAFNASTLGNIAQSGSGAVNLIGTMTLDQASTNLSTAGLTALTIDGGTVAGGGNTLTSNGTLALSATGYGTLNNVTLATDLAVTGVTYLTNGLTLAANATTSNPATVTINNATLHYTGTQTLGGTGNVVFSGASNSWFYRNGAAATLTVGPNVTVSGSGTGSAIFGYSADEAIDFKGVLNANVAGKTWYLGGFANTGNINVSAGTVRMDTYSGTGSWTNTSTVGKGIAVSGTGVLNLVDAFNASTLGNIAQSGGGAVNLIGTMTLDQASTNLSTAGLTALTIDGGTVAGGGNTLTSNGTLALSATGYGTLNNVTLATDLAVTGVTYLTNGLTLAANATTSNPATVTINNATLHYTGTQTLGGTGNVVFSGASNSWFYRNGAAATLTVGPNVTVSGSGTGSAIFGYSADEAIDFKGVLNANVAGKTWYLGGFANTGNINVSAGTVRMDTYSGTGSWTNTSTVGKGIAVSGTGVLNLGDAFNASTLGNIAQSGSGAVNLIGTMTLDQASTNLSTAGLTALTIDGGTVAGGGNTLTSNGSLALTATGYGTFSNLTLATDLTVSGTFYLTNGLTLATNATTLNPATVTLGTGGDLRYTGTQTLGGTGNLVFGGASTTWFYRNGAAATLTVGPNITVSGSGTGSAVFGYSADEAINFQGVLNANVAGKTWYLGGFASTGNINVSAGTVRMDTYSGTGAWTNTSTVGKGIAVSGTGVLDLSDGFTTTGIGRITRSGGTINISGTLDNTGQTLDIGAGGPFGAGGLSSLTGRITNGTIISGDGTLLNSPSGSLDGVTIGSNFGFAAGGYANIYNSLLLTNGITVNKGNTEWYFRSGGTQNLAMVSGSATINTASGGLYAGYGVAGQTLQIGSGITYQGYGYISDSAAATIVNNGTLIANTTGQTLTINPTSLTNNGTLRVTAGTLTVSPTNWTNSATGSIEAQGGTLTLNGSNLGNSGALSLSSGSIFNLGGTVTLASLGTFTRAAGSTFNLTGTLDLGGATLDIGSGGAFKTGGLSSLTGTIANGTLVSNDGTLLNSSGGSLDGITLGSSLGFTSGTTSIYNSLQLASGITVNKGASTWYFRTTGVQNLATVSGGATINTAGGGLYAGWGVSGQTLQIGSGITYQGYGTISDSSVATIVNSGTLIANTVGQTLSINPTNLTNSGTLQVTAGTLSVAPTNWTNTGTISIQGGSFSLSGSNLVNTGTTTVDPGATLTLTGNLTLASLGTFSRGAGSSINLSGTLALGGGTLDIGSAGAFGTGGLTTLTGTIANGTIVSNDGTLLNSSGGALDGITLGSSLGFTSGGTHIYNNLQLASGITVNKGANTWYFRSTGAQNLTTVSGSATINTASGGLYAGWGVAGQTLQIGSGITYQGYGTISDSSVATIVNNGTLIGNTAGQTLSISPTTFTNNNLVNAVAGTVTLSPTTLTNAGTLRIQSGATMNTGTSTTMTSAGSGIDLQSGGTFGLNGTYTISGGGLAIVSGATVNLESAMTVAEFANLNFQGGEAVLNSTLTNAGTLTLNGTGGTLRLAGSGRINGGTISTSGAVELASSGGTLDGVTLDAEMTVVNGGTLQILNGLTFANGHQISLEANAASSILYINGTGTQTLGGTGGIAFVGSGSGHSVTYFSGTPSLSLGANVTVDVLSGGGSFWNVGQALTLNGALNMSAAGATLQTNVSGLTRGGGSAVNVTAGTLRLNGANDDADYNGAWNVSAGASLQMAHTAARTLGAGFSATGAGRVVVDQGGALVTTINGMANSTATFALNNGGTLTASSAISLGGLELTNGTVNGASAITVTGDVTMSNGNLAGAGSLAIGGNLLWSGGTIARTGGVTLAGSGSTWSAGTLSGGTLTNNGTLRVTGATGTTVLTTATLANNGSLVIDKTGGVFYINTSGILSNAAAATFDLQSDLGITSATGGGSISNAGTLTKTAGTAAAIGSLVPVNFTNGSTVDVSAGREISFVGGGSFAGTVTGLGVGGTLDGGNWSSSGGTLAGQWQWRAGTLNSGTLTNTGTLHITGASGNAVLTTATLANSGSVIIDKTGGVFYLNTSGVIDNLAAGTLDLQSDGIAINSSTGGGSISNAGLLTKTAGTSSSISTLVPIAFSNGSSSAVSAGRAILMQGGGSLAGTVNGTGVGATLDGGNWASTAGVLTGNWQWRSGSLGSGTLTNSGSLAITGATGNAILIGATLANNGSLLIDKTGGVFYINTAGIVNNNGLTVLQGTVGITSSTGSGTFNNTGIFRQTSASSLAVNALVSFTQGAAALIDVQAGTLTIGTLAGGSNPGVITLASGATLAIGGSFTNSGTISGSGTLDLGANTLTNNGFLSPGTGGDATGTLTINGNLVLGPSSFLVAQLDSTAVGDSDVLAVSGNVNYGGTLTLSGAATSGSYNVVTSATRTPASTFATVNGSLAGANPSYSGTSLNILIALGGHWTGLGDGITWTSAANWGLSTLPGAGDDVYINTAGPTIVLSSGAQAINSLTMAAGRTLQITGGSLAVAQASNLAGDIALTGGTLAFNGATTVSGSFTQTGGTLGGTGTLTLTGATNSWSGTSGSWTGGGAVVLSSGANFNFTGTGTGNIFAGRTLTIDAGATATVAGNIELDAGTNVINNGGTLNLTGTAIRHAFNGQGALTLTNTGTINKTGAGTFILGSSPVAEHVTLTNSGFINVNAGTLAYAGGTGTSNGTVNVLATGTWQTDGATMNFAGGSTFNSAGTILTSAGTANFLMPTGSFTQTGNITTSGGTVNFSPDVNVPQINLSGGVTNFNGAATTPAYTQTGGTLGGTGTLTLTGATNSWSGTSGSWTGGGAVVLSSGANFNFTGTGTGNIFAGRTLTIDAGATATVAGNIELDAGTNVINNGGTLNLTGTAIRHAFNGQGALTLTNTGTINKTGAGTFILGSSPVAEHVTLTNSGFINVNAGTLDHVGGTLTQNGLIEALAGATFSKPGGFTNALGGTLAGEGTFDVGVGNTLTNNGTVAPGLSSGDTTGALSITGHYAQGAGGTLSMQLDSTAAGNYDQLLVSGSASLNGTLNLTGSATSGSFPLVSAASRTGTFSALTGPVGGNSNYTATGLNFDVILGLFWTGAVNNEWSNPGNWSTGVLPGVTDFITIGTAGNLTLSSGSYAIRGINTVRNFTLSGGASLSLAEPSTIGGNVTLNGGTLTGVGPLAIGGTLNVVAASTVGVNTAVSGLTTVAAGGLALGAATTFTANGGFDWSGGTLSGANSSSSIFVLPSGDTMNLTGGSKELSGATLQNNGTIALNLAPGNTLQLSNSATLTNAGTISFNDNNGIAPRSGFGPGTFNNVGGTLVVAAGKTGSVTVENASFSGNSTLDTSAAGSLLTLAPSLAANYSGTLNALGAGVSFANGGATHTFASGSTLNGTFTQSTGNTAFNNTTLNTTYNLQGGTLSLTNGTTTLNGTLNYAGGAIGGPGAATLALSAGDVLNVSGGTKEFSGAVLQNGGTVNLNLSPGNNLQISNGANFNNTGTINFNDNVGIAPRSGFGPGTFNNVGGTLAVAAGKTGSVTVESTSFSGNGTLDTSAAGSALTLAPMSSASYSGTLNALGSGVSFANGGATHNFAGTILNGTFTQSTGNTNFDTVTLNGTYNVQGGNLILGAGVTTLNGTLNYAGGVIGGAGGATLALSAGDVLNVSGGTKEFSGSLLQNGGTINLNLASGNTFQLSNGGTLANTGTIYFNDNVGIAPRSGFGPGAFNNAGGTLVVAAGKTGSVTVESASFSGTSTFDTSAAGSQLALAPLSSASYSGTLNALGSGVSFANGGATHNFAGTILNGTFTQSTGNTNFDTVTLNGTYNLQGGNLTLGSGVTTLNGTLNYAGGAISGSGGTALALSAGDVLNVSGGTKEIWGTTLQNGGTVNLNLAAGNNLQISNGGNFNNTGTINFNDNVGIAPRSGFGPGTFNSVGGTLAVAAGKTGSVTIENASFSGNSTFDTSAAGSAIVLAPTTSASYAGSLDVVGNGLTFAAGGATHVVADGTLLNGNMTLAGGAMQLGSVQILGDFVHTGGSLATGAGKTVNVVAGGSLSLASGATFGGSGTLINEGTVTFNGNTLGHAIQNSGAMVLNGTNTFSGASFMQDGGTLTLASAGALTKSGGAFTWSGGDLQGVASGLALTGGATASIAGGGSKVLDGVNMTVVSTDVVAGTLEVRSGTLNAGTTTIAGGATLFNNGGTVNTGALANNGTFRQAAGGTSTIGGGGTHTGTFDVAAGGTMDFAAGAQIFNGATLAGAGAFTRSGATLNVAAGGLTIGNGTAIDLNALALAGTGPITNNGAVTGNGFTWGGNFTNGATGSLALTNGGIAGNFFNYGTFDVTGTVVLSGAVADQLGGQIRIPAGAVLERTTGPFRWVNGTVGGDGVSTGNLSFTGGGSFQFAGTGDRVIDGLNFTFNNLTLPDGSLTLQSGSLTLNGSTLLPAGVALNLNGGTLSNNGTLDIGGTFDLAGGSFAGTGSLTMSGGSLTLPATNSVSWTNSGALTNTGTLNLAAATITNAIDNQGTINAGNGLVFTQTFVNNGTLILGSGTTTFSAGLVQNSGQTQMNNGSVNGSVTINAGMMMGGGTINGSLTMAGGTLAVGFSPGTLNIGGNLTLGSASTTAIELGGAGAGQYDLINVSGNAALDGALVVTYWGGFSGGGSFPVMSWGSSSGTFASTSFPAAGFTLAYGASGMTLDLAAVLPATATALSNALAEVPVNPLLVMLAMNDPLEDPMMIETDEDGGIRIRSLSGGAQPCR